MGGLGIERERERERERETETDRQRQRQTDTNKKESWQLTHEVICSKLSNLGCTVSFKGFVSCLPYRNLEYCVSMYSSHIKEHIVDRIETILESWGEVKGRVHSPSSENKP